MIGSFLSQQLLFQVSSSAIILLLFWGLSTKKNIREQLGFLYLFSLPTKLFFYYYFFPFLFDTALSLSTSQKASILFPLFVFLVVEVLILAKLLKQKTFKDI